MYTYIYIYIHIYTYTYIYIYIYDAGCDVAPARGRESLQHALSFLLLIQLNINIACFIAPIAYSCSMLYRSYAFLSFLLPRDLFKYD